MNNKVIPAWDTDLNARLEQVNSLLAEERLKQEAEEQERQKAEVLEELNRKRPAKYQQEAHRSKKKQEKVQKEQIFQRPKPLHGCTNLTRKTWKNVAVGSANNKKKQGVAKVVSQDAEDDNQYKCSFCNARFYSICAWNGHKRNCHRKL